MAFYAKLAGLLQLTTFSTGMKSPFLNLFTLDNNYSGETEGEQFIMTLIADSKKINLSAIMNYMFSMMQA